MLNLTLYVLLDTIQNKKNLRGLLRSGLTYKAIAESTEEAIRHKLIESSDTEISLTPLGKIKLDELSAANKKNDKSTWIEKDFKSQIEKLEADMIYLPFPDELTF